MPFDTQPQNLIDDPNITLQRADAFSRGTLDLTFRLLRKNRPGLALQVRNLMAAEVVPLSDHDHYSPAGDHFLVTLSAQQIGCVVDALTQLGQNALQDHSGDTGHLIVLKTLIKEWMTLAEWIILSVEQEHF